MTAYDRWVDEVWAQVMAPVDPAVIMRALSGPLPDTDALLADSWRKHEQEQSCWWKFAA